MSFPKLERVLFPLFMSSALLCCWLAFEYFNWPHAVASGVVTFVFGFLLIPLFERLTPYRKDWLNADGDVMTDVLHLLVNNGLIINIEKVVLTGLLLSATAWLTEKFGGALWPHHWPLLAQLFLMLLIAEFGRYWVHFAAHKIPLLWRFHAVHHSPNRLYFLNAGRFHPVEKVLFQVPELVPFILLGTNIETLTLYLTFNGIHGLFQHSNIRIRSGWLNYVFSMTELHRWHHSKVPDESDHNFGNNLIVWDLLFGTYFNPRTKGGQGETDDVGDIGVQNPAYPRSYGQQLVAPFWKQDVSKNKHIATEKERTG